MEPDNQSPAAIIVFNPLSGRGKAEQYARLAQRKFEAQGWMIKATLATQYAGHAEQVLAAEWCHQVDLIVVIGGDGTLRELVTGLINANAQTCLGFIPLGNANVMAREFGIPLQPEQAIDALLRSRIITPDIGAFQTKGSGTQYFLAMIEIGQGAKIVHFVDQLRKGKLKTLYRIWGDIVYLIAGILAFSSGKPSAKLARFRLKLDGAEQEQASCQAVISSIRTYSKGWAMTPDAVCDDGKLNLVASSLDSPLAFGRHMLAAAVGKPRRHPEVHYAEGRNFEITADGPLYIQADGDVVTPTTSLAIQVIQAAYRLKVPVSSV